MSRVKLCLLCGEPHTDPKLWNFDCHPNCKYWQDYFGSFKEAYDYLHEATRKRKEDERERALSERTVAQQGENQHGENSTSAKGEASGYQPQPLPPPLPPLTPSEIKRAAKHQRKQ